MQPSNSMGDYYYTMELNRLFPKTPANEVMSTPNTYQRPFKHPTPNYSSSSTDSFSPESFPELSYNRSDCYRGPEYRALSDTPRLPETAFSIARRPIVGRKILANTDHNPIEQKCPSEERFRVEPRSNTPLSPISPWLDSNTSPNVKEETYPMNAYYELFPGENKGFEFKTPVKTPTYSNKSPTSPLSQTSPVKFNYGMFTPPQYTNPLIIGASPMNIRANSPMNARASSPMRLGASTSGFPDGEQKMCTFCRKNGETPLVYMTHAVKEKRGTRNIVTCPILRSHVCKTCGDSGDNAHTMTYCPVLRSTNNGMPLKSTTITLKNTRIKSNGRRRY